MSKSKEYIPRVILSEAAIETIDILRKRFDSELMFHQSGGCCDGSSPMWFEKGEFKVGASDIWLGEVYGCDFFMIHDQFEYWKHTQLTLDVTPGRGSSFFYRNPHGNPVYDPVKAIHNGGNGKLITNKNRRGSTWRK